MSRIEYSDLTQSVLKRLFLFGLPAGVGAALFWYFGGMRYWGYLVVTLAKLLGFWTTVQFDGRDLIYQVTLEMGGTSFIAFKMNQFNLSFLEVMTLLGAWRHRSVKAGFRLAGWSVLILLGYQAIAFLAHCHAVEIGPDFANSQHIMWESSWWYVFMKNVAAFQTFILRYWAGFPVFALALLANTLTTGKPKTK